MTFNILFLIQCIVCVLVIFILIRVYNNNNNNNNIKEQYNTLRSNEHINYDNSYDNSDDYESYAKYNNKKSPITNINDYNKQDQEQCEYQERERLDNFNDEFFNFKTRINNNSQMDDPVDKINRMSKIQDYNADTKISDVYDNLVSAGDYKYK